MEGDPCDVVYKEIKDWGTITMRVFKEIPDGEHTCVQLMHYCDEDDLIGKYYNDPADWKRLKL